jgi:predicted dehydrogenase
MVSFAMSRQTRRQFLSESALLAAAATALGAVNACGDEPSQKPDVRKPAPTKAAPPAKVPASERLRVAVIGLNGRGMDHLKEFALLPDTEVAMLCDCDADLAAKAIKATEALQKTTPAFVQDLRKVMENKAIDVVTIATPNHWHSLAAIWAIQAGKDVYVEKPVSHNVFEGRQLVNYARKHKRLAQAGMQGRSSPGMREAIAFIHSGGIGEVKKAKGLCYKLRLSIGPKTNREPPKGVDYNLWCGPAPMDPVNRGRFHYDWHWLWNYGNGDLGNQGIHEMDKARWGLGLNRLCDSVFSLGGRFGYEDAGETANTQLALMTFGDKQIIFEVRGLVTADPFGKNKGKNFCGNIWYGSEGMVVSSSYDAAVALRPDGEVIKRWKGGANHYANFVQAVKARDPRLLNAEIEEGHFSSALCHLANISYRLGSLQPLGGALQIITDSGLRAEFEQMKEHLAENKVTADGDQRVRCGPELHFDSAAERFRNCDDANNLLSREYRKGFEVVPV